MVTFVRPDLPQLILEATNSGQTRYKELVKDIGESPQAIDRTLIDMAKRGEVSLIAVGDVLTVKANVSEARAYPTPDSTD